LRTSHVYGVCSFPSFCLAKTVQQGYVSKARAIVSFKNRQEQEYEASQE